MILMGEHVLLRPLRRTDAAIVESWLHEPETTRWMVLGRTVGSAEAWVAALANGWPRDCAMAMESFSGLDGRAAGIIGLFDIDWLQRRAELRIVLGRSLRGRGCGTEAVGLILRYGFQALDLWRIWLGTAAENVLARRCFERAGFLQEGVLCQDFLGPDGRRGDNVRYAILRPRWEALVENAQRQAARGANGGA